MKKSIARILRSVTVARPCQVVTHYSGGRRCLSSVPSLQKARRYPELHLRREFSSHEGTSGVVGGTTIDTDEEELVSQFFKAARGNDVAGAEDILESEIFRNLKDAVNFTDAFGNSPLMICAQRNWHESITLLLANDYCDANHQNIFGSSALMCCSSHGHIDALKVLLESKKVEIDLMSRFGQTAMMKAAQAGKLASIKLLLHKGADPAILNKKGKGAIQIAEEKSHNHVVEFLTLLQNSAPQQAETIL